jgi:hypothetical protein
MKWKSRYSPGKGSFPNDAHEIHVGVKYSTRVIESLLTVRFFKTASEEASLTIRCPCTSFWKAEEVKNGCFTLVILFIDAQFFDKSKVSRGQHGKSGDFTEVAYYYYYYYYYYYIYIYIIFAVLAVIFVIFLLCLCFLWASILLTFLLLLLLLLLLLIITELLLLTLNYC